MNKTVLRKIAFLFLIIIIMILLTCIYHSILLNNEKKNILLQERKKEDNIFKNVDKEISGYVDLYTIYGNHLNINGYILKDDLSNINVDNYKLIVENTDENISEYDLITKIQDDKVVFKLSENINEGIDLNKIENGKYFVFLKLIGSYENKKVERIVSIKNVSNYESNDYYTLTANNSNNIVAVSFGNYTNNNNSLEYMNIKSEYSTLPLNTYDIVIDAGHGGKDPGAMYEDYKEADITLEYSLLLKKKLESLGYKVKLTRDEDKYIESYGNKGRAVIPYKTKAKLTLSIHLNSTANKNSEGGVEVYAPNNANLEFAKSIADNIVNYTNGKYSINTYAKSLDGVYVRTYTEEEIEEAIVYAHDLEYEPYETLSTQTPYLFMIRETGGIMTKAYIDGRNKTIGNNPYHNSNISSEAYLLELGFINSVDDLNNLINKKEEYVNAIVDSIINNYK